MSGNIQDTDVNRLKDDINKLLIELDDIITKGDTIKYHEDTLKRKYKYIVKTSENLWKLIIDQYGNSSFNKTLFLTNLGMMLSSILDIQAGKITQHNASQNVGETLASQFIPQLKK
jgi:hypothetical protein